MTIELINLAKFRVWCDVPECTRSVENEIRMDIPNDPDGWPEVRSEGGDRLTRVIAHYCPDHAYVAAGHVPVVEKRRRFPWSRLWVTSCTCGRMSGHTCVSGCKATWLAHVESHGG